ncbi:S8 family serine peptidase [Actinokineospora guangxiensis]|uniref:S8 family serine peptidase n=1 Tax=Actinokineospora guangxiensis TaxID=1490288 RepID=A0ABW0ESP9_9PSEU
MPRSRPRRRVALAVVPVLLGAALAGSGTATGQPAGSEQTAEAPIRLVSGEFFPGRLPAPRVRALAAGERGGYLVQFAGAIREDWKAGLLGAGAEIVDYIPENAYRVRMNPGQAARVASLPGVHWVGRFQPAWKVTADARAEITEGKPAVYEVRAEAGADPSAVAAAARGTGAVVTETGDGGLLLAATPAQATSVAGIEGVAVVDGFRVHERHNEHAAGTIMRGEQAYARGYDGSTQVVAVADTGFGGGTAATGHPDVPASRVVAIRDWPSEDIPDCADARPDGAQDVDSGHGTHVAVSAVGDGMADGRGKAAAHGARLVFQAVEDHIDMFGSCASYGDGYYLLGIPIDLGLLFQQAYDDGARIHANSWGSDSAGAYTEDSRYADKFSNEHRDMLITFSAGNAGVDADANGVIDPRSVGAPGTAKNVLTVGASENGKAASPCDPALTYQAQGAAERATMGNRSCAQAGGQNVIPTWGDWWSSDYPVNPLRSDRQTGNAQQLAAFSSRGPTTDGRIKPDIVAPGSWISSGYSDMHQQQYDGTVNPATGLAQDDGYGFPLNDDYKYFSGTSMSNPLAAGGAAVVRDYYKKHHGIDATSALVRGTIVNSATDLLDENNDGVNDNDFPIPNIHEGWGLVNLDKATAGTARHVDEGAGLATGGVTEHRVRVTPGSPFKVTLAYTDREAATTAARSLVNDLDLEVVSPSGVVYRGNGFAGGWSRTGTTADTANNLENVFIQAPGEGDWTVRVRGRNVPFGPQTFALVMDGRVAAATNEMLRNPGFEYGPAADWAGKTSVITNSTARPAHEGSWWARFGGTGRKGTETLHQDVPVPGNATAVAVSYWVRVDTAETTTTGQYDKLQLRVLSTSGTVLGTLGTVSNLDASGAYVQKTHDLSAYKGQTIRLAWVASEDSSKQTTFAVDSTSVRWS